MKLLAVILMCGTFGETLLAANINTSRANIRSSTDAQDASDKLAEVSKVLEYASDETNPKVLKEIADIERKTAELKERVLVTTFTKMMMEEIDKMRCKSLEDEKCLTRAFMRAYDKSHRLTR